MLPLLILLSVGLHLYVAAVGLQEAGPSGFLLGLLIWNLVPVLVGALVARSNLRRQGIGWLVATLSSSTWAVWVGLLRPQGSTSALIFLVLPFWNLLVVGPGGALLATLWTRYVLRRANAA